MNGIPKLDALRSISLYGLSSITMNFEYDTDPYFAREQAFERMPDARCRRGVTPGMSPLFSPSGLIYRYVLQSPDRSAQDLKILEDWVLERRYRAIQGVADDSGLGGDDDAVSGAARSEQKLFAYGVSVPQIVQQLAGEQRERGRRLLFAGRPVLLRARPRPGEEPRGHRQHRRRDAQRDSRSTSRMSRPWRSITRRASASSATWSQDDAVEGVILMRVGEQAQVVLKKVEAITEALNRSVLPPDVKIVPYYDRTSLVEETTKTVERNLLRGMLLVLVILGCSCSASARR